MFSLASGISRGTKARWALRGLGNECAPERHFVKHVGTRSAESMCSDAREYGFVGSGARRCSLAWYYSGDVVGRHRAMPETPKAKADITPENLKAGRVVWAYKVTKEQIDTDSEADTITYRWFS